MNGRHLGGIVAAIGLLATVTVGSVLLGVGPVATALGGEDAKPPALVDFQSAGAQCTDDFRSNASTSIVTGGPNTEITHERNVSLPNPSYAIGDPTFERINESAYRLSLPTEATEKEPRDCAAVARYEATMRIPAGQDPWRLVVVHDGEIETVLWGDSDSSLTGGSASAGGSSSA